MNRLLPMALLLLTCSACTPVHSKTASSNIGPPSHLGDTQLNILQENNAQQRHTTLHGISRDVASVDSGGDNVIRRGERGRIAQDSIAPRLEHTLTELYPWLSSDKMIATLIADLPAARALPSDQAWRDTVDFENEKIQTLHFDNRSQPARGSEDDQLNQYPAINPDSRGMLY